MTKRKPALRADQLAFTFEAPLADVSEGALESFERQIASGVGRVLKEYPGSRFEVAGQVSALLNTDVSKAMLDAYSAEAKDGHNISVARFLALIVVTQRFDVLDAVLRQVGCGLLVGEEIYLAEVGHLKAQERIIQQRLKQLTRETTPLKRGGQK